MHRERVEHVNTAIFTILYYLQNLIQLISFHFSAHALHLCAILGIYGLCGHQVLDEDIYSIRVASSESEII